MRSCAKIIASLVAVLIILFVSTIYYLQTRAPIPLPSKATALTELFDEPYVGNCCLGYQYAYHSEKPISEVQAFYELTYGEKFVRGEKTYPAHPNFENYGHYSSTLWLYIYEPERSRSTAVFLIEAYELSMSEGTVIIYQKEAESP